MRHHAGQGDITIRHRRPPSPDIREAQTCPIRSYPARSRSAIGRGQLRASIPAAWRTRQLGMASPRRYAPRARNEHTHHPPLRESVCSHSTAGSQHAPRCFKPRRRSARVPQKSTLKLSSGPPFRPRQNTNPQTGTPKGLGNQRVAHAALSRDQITWHAWSNTYVGPWATYRLLICVDRWMTAA